MTVADFPELLEGPDDLYVRRGCEQGFTPEQCEQINALRLQIRNGECITTEGALQLVRAALTKGIK
jgi:hypothetical protein